MIETINGKAYLKVGDKVYELGGGSNLITADSVVQLPDPASVPEGTIALVPSEGESGGGLPVITLSEETSTSLLSGEHAILTTDEQAAFEAVAQNESSVEVKIKMSGATFLSIICNYMSEGYTIYTGTAPSTSWGDGAIIEFTIIAVRFYHNTTDGNWNGSFGMVPVLSEE